ncbi:MAG: ABC transporter substrate-binding protein [Chloroflexi bacterium]|nr:ABC transporter substrate-binding protein [Chloroflexota bacterium]
MAGSLIPLQISPTGMRLHEWIALERGYFQDAGIEPHIRWDVVRGTMTSWKGLNYLERPQDKPFRAGEQTITNACAWGSICNAGAGMGKFVPDAYGVARWAIYVRPDSRIQRPEDLANVPIAVGMRAGSHFNVPYRLEAYLPLDQIKTVNVGGFGARLQALLEGEVEAASLLDPQISMAEELGLRCVIANTFKTLWWVDERYDRAILDRFFRVLQRAEEDLTRDPASCLPLWRYSIPPEFQNRSWDYSRFDPGERFHYEPLPRAEFEEIVRQVERWGLDDYMQEKSFDALVLPVRA